MEPDCYQVEVLYYLNPHLIWIEVVEKSQQEFVFEQVGIYGVLPFETTITADGESLESRRCEEWTKASTVLMKKSLFDAKQVWFRPTHIDRRTSIFDDNIHKYGELIIKTHDNKKFELSKILLDSGFALLDVCLFHQQLSLGNLKTKLNYAKTQEIIKHLEKDTRTSNKAKKHRESSVKKQTTVFQAAQSLEMELTEKNLRRHDISHSKVNALLEMKSKDFELCKDVDYESVGRASTVKRNARISTDGERTESKKKETRIKKAATPKTEESKTEDSKVQLLLKKKLDLIKGQKTQTHDPLQVLLATKKYLEENSKVVTDTDSNKMEDDETNHEERKRESHSQTDSDRDIHLYDDHKKVQSSKSEDRNSCSDEYSPVSKPIKRNAKRHKKNSTKIPEYDITTENRVAYGPPGIDSKYLSLKVVPKKPDEEVKLVSKEDLEFVEPKKSLEMYADVDSDADDSNDVLKENFNTNSTVEENFVKDVEPVKPVEYVSKDDSLNDSSKTQDSTDSSHTSLKLSAVQKKLKLLKEIKAKQAESTVTSSASDTTNKDSSTSCDVQIKKKPINTSNNNVNSDDEDITELVAKISQEYPPTSVKTVIEKTKKVTKVGVPVKNNVNPFKNIDSSISVFVDKLVSPVLMVHNKMNYPIEPYSNIRDMYFNANIHVVLKNLGVEKPMMLQMVSWPVVLRGYSLFMIGPLGSGKTFGYLPAICRLITDDCGPGFVDSVGPTCIIVCATAQSVTEVEHYAKMFLGLDEKVVACYAGVDDLHITTSLLNGCNLFICTPTVLVRLLQMTDFGIDIRRLSTFVLEDCERLSEVYAAEMKYVLIKIREMLKIRANKELKVQFIVASRIWCDFMASLAKKSPNSVICIGAFQECVLYSKANMSVDFLKKINKLNKVLEFLEEIDKTKKTVIVCRASEEVDEIAKVLTKNKYVVYACNYNMTVEDLYNLSKSWGDYQEPVLGPILVCCDGNLNHLNVTDAHYLIHYSLPHLFSMFCKRFSVLNDHYPSVFREENETVKIKVFLEDSNVEQLPKILNFIKRCTDNVPEFLDEVCEKVVQEKNMIKAKRLVPICDNLLAFGECPDLWNCQERHAIFKEFDEPKEWMPRSGVVTFKILHYHTPVQYSARLLTSTSNGNTKKYPQTYSMLSLKLGMYFSKEANRKLHGVPQVGDICAVSVKQNFFVRCQVLKILTRYNNRNPNCVLIKMIDEEKLEKARDIYLFHLPEELKKMETHIVQVRLANVCPKDKDVTYSEIAKESVKKIVGNDEDLFMRGHIALTVGGCILVDTLEACQELTSLNETVVMHNLKKELLSSHAIENPEHVVKIEKLCGDLIVAKDDMPPRPAPVKHQKDKLKPQWAHLESDMSVVYFASAENPDVFFVRLAKFESCMNLLLNDIKKYIEGEPTPLERVTIGDVVLAKFPDDLTYDRAVIDDIINDKVVKCFFVDQGDWRDVQIKDLLKIPTKFITQMPFQAIECRLIGIKPAGDDWTDFGTNWFCDYCFDANGDPKMLYVKYFTKTSPQYTEGRKYGVAIIDTNGEQDVVINKLMVELNLAQENDEEVQYLEELDHNKFRESDEKASLEDSDEDLLEDLPKIEVPDKTKALVPVNTIQEPPRQSLDNIFLKQPIRSVPLVDSDNESVDSWDIVNPKELVAMIKGVSSVNDQRSNVTPKQNQDENDETQDNFNRTNNKEQPNVVSLTPKTECIATDPPVIVNDEPKITVLKQITDSKQKSKEISLDSDDFSSTEVSQVSENIIEIPKIEEKILLNALEESSTSVDLNKVDERRKPKLLWRQNKTSVSIKILLIGSESYKIELQERCLKFEALCNDIKYGFDFDLYGVVENLQHSDKGQYILVKINKIIKKNWLSLTKDTGIRKWIVYDVDSIDTSSDEDEEVPNTLAQVVKELHEREGDSESDDDLLDDIEYQYKDFC